MKLENTKTLLCSVFVAVGRQISLYVTNRRMIFLQPLVKCYVPAIALGDLLSGHLSMEKVKPLARLTS